jgi:Polyferredoxin
MNYLSPYLIIAGAIKGIVTGSLIFFILLFICSLFLGRAFCSYVCPAAGLQEICFSIQDKRIKGGDWIKYLFWFPWMSAIIILAVRAGGYRVLNPFFYTDYGISISNPLSYLNYYMVILIITVLVLSSGRRSFCHHVCWMAPFMIIGTKIRNLLKWPALHLEAEKDKCVSCQRCTQECPMSLDVQKMVNQEKLSDPECILCGNCVDVCMKKAIKYTWK